MSLQRRRGPLATITPLVEKTNNRGEKVTAPGTVTLAVRGALLKVESASLKVPGGIGLRMADFHTDYGLDPSVGVGALVEVDGKSWEVMAPPTQHGSHRANRYTKLKLRERPTK